MSFRLSGMITSVFFLVLMSSLIFTVHGDLAEVEDAKLLRNAYLKIIKAGKDEGQECQDFSVTFYNDISKLDDTLELWAGKPPHFFLVTFNLLTQEQHDPKILLKLAIDDYENRLLSLSQRMCSMKKALICDDGQCVKCNSTKDYDQKCHNVWKISQANDDINDPQSEELDTIYQILGDISKNGQTIGESCDATISAKSNYHLYVAGYNDVDDAQKYFQDKVRASVQDKIKDYSNSDKKSQICSSEQNLVCVKFKAKPEGECVSCSQIHLVGGTTDHAELCYNIVSKLKGESTDYKIIDWPTTTTTSTTISPVEDMDEFSNGVRVKSSSDQVVVIIGSGLLISLKLH